VKKKRNVEPGGIDAAVNFESRRCRPPGSPVFSSAINGDNSVGLSGSLRHKFRRLNSRTRRVGTRTRRRVSSDLNFRLAGISFLSSPSSHLYDIPAAFRVRTQRASIRVTRSQRNLARSSRVRLIRAQTAPTFPGDRKGCPRNTRHAASRYHPEELGSFFGPPVTLLLPPPVRNRNPRRLRSEINMSTSPAARRRRRDAGLRSVFIDRM